MSLHNVAYLPIELRTRELPARLPIAVHLLRRGHSVMIGQQWSMFANLAALPPGVVMFKTVNEIQGKAMHEFKRHGHRVAALDEECLCYLENFCLRFCATAARNCDVFFAQNTVHADEVRAKFPSLAGRVVVTGNPRIDLTNSVARAALQPGVDWIKHNYGRFILVNTNHASINSIMGDEDAVFDITVRAKVLRADQRDVFDAWMAWERAGHAELLKFIEWASLAHKVVVRVHPTENAAPWMTLAATGQNITVVQNTPAVPWMLAAEIVVHTTCTTGLEAALLGRPVINIEPYENPHPGQIMRVVNPTFSTAIDATKAAAEWLASGTGPLAAQPNMAQYFPNHDNSDAAEDIAHALGKELVGAGGVDWYAVAAQFGATERHDKLVQKCSIAPDDMRALLKAEMKRAGYMGNVAMQCCDDSLFLLEPKE